MKRRKKIGALSTKDAGSVLTSVVLPGAIGAIVAGMVTKAIPAEYAKYSNYITAGLGIAAALASDSPMFKAAGVGAATVATYNVAQDLLDGQTGLGLLPPGAPARYLAGFDDGKTFDGQQFPFRGFP